MSHLAKLYVDGAEIDLDSFISKEEVLQIADAQIKLESPNALKPYFDYFEEKRLWKNPIGISNIRKENAVH
jgi:ATP-dependent DNA helicase RecQ